MKSNNFSSGPVWKNILSQAVPYTVAQLVHLLYNIVDRIYLGHMGDGNGLALTGVGLTFPVVSFIAAFSALFGNGGVPLFSIERGAGNDDKAERIMGNSFALLLISSVVLTFLGYVFSKPILFAFGASENSYVFAQEYLKIYLLGTVFSMISTGMNGYINAQGFPKIGMTSVIIGAVINVVLDPIFIFALDMGVSGAALATVISQALSAIWVVTFLFGKKVSIPLNPGDIKVNKTVTGEICKLGASNFIMTGTTCFVQIVCNSTLQIYGGDLYIGIMTVTNSVREIFSLAVNGLMAGSQPVISYNYGAKEYARVKEGIRFNTVVGIVYTAFAWLLAVMFPSFWLDIFTDNALLMKEGAAMLKIYFFGFVFMSLQFSGQSTFLALGDSKHAVFFSILRKAIIVVPLTVLLPMAGFGVAGVFMAEPISNVVGGIACYTTMKKTVYKKL